MTQYPDEVKAAVMAALLQGQSVNQVAKQFDIPAGTVSSWRRRVAATPVVDHAGTREHIGELLVSYLEASLQTLRAQVVVFRTPEWLMKQNASEAAVLHGVLTDKVIRLLEALAASDTLPVAPTEQSE